MKKEDNVKSYSRLCDEEGEIPSMCGGSIEYGLHCSTCKHAIPGEPCKLIKTCYIYESIGE